MNKPTRHSTAESSTPKTDLLSLVLNLSPVGKPDPEKALPRWWGRAGHAVLLKVIKQYDESLASALHEPDGNPRPFTASTLMGRFPSGELDMEGAYTMRLTATREDVAGILWEAAQPGGALAPGATVQLDYLPFQIESTELPVPIRDEPHEARNEISPWAGMTSYQALSAPYLLGKEKAPRRVALLFTSPTAFKSGGMHVPIPMPDLVFGSLLNQWNAYAPIAFPPEARRYAEACLAVSRYKLSSRVVPVKSRGVRVGGVGEITYTSLNYDRYWMSVIHCLAAFALYAGVGGGTSMGLGQCRKVEDG